MSLEVPAESVGTAHGLLYTSAINLETTPWTAAGVQSWRQRVLDFRRCDREAIQAPNDVCVCERNGEQIGVGMTLGNEQKCESTCK